MTETFTDWNLETPRQLSSGVAVSAVTGANLQVVRTQLPGGARPYPMHSHPHEQFVVVLEGSVEFTVDGAGTQTLGPGGVFYFAPDQGHSVRVLTDDPVVMLEIYTPVRIDYADPSSNPDPANPR